MRFKMRRELAADHLGHRDLLTAALRTFLEDDPVGDGAYQAALSLARSADLDAMFGRSDVLVTPAAPGRQAVPFGAKGDPALNRFATLLGLPTVTSPFGRGPRGFPLGLQLLARPGRT